jgi:hypothetical protein
MLLYGIIEEVNEFTDIRRDQRYLVESEKQWVFNQIKFTIGQNIARKHSMGRNSMSKSSLINLS